MIFYPTFLPSKYSFTHDHSQRKQSTPLAERNENKYNFCFSPLPSRYFFPCDSSSFSFFQKHFCLNNKQVNKNKLINNSPMSSCDSCGRSFQSIAWVFATFPKLSQLSLSIDCIVPKRRREPLCQGGSQTRGAAGRSGSPSMRRCNEVWWSSFPRCWPMWISRPRHLRGLPL